MTVRLLPETTTVAAGGTVTVALVMTPQRGWHGYWQNPGDAGVGTRIAWALPKGMAAGPIRFPVPVRLMLQGLMNYVYEGEHALLVDLKAPAGAATGARLPIRGRVDYLVCTDKICVPESADVAAELAVGPPGAREAAFDGYREALPKPLGALARFERRGNLLRIGIPVPASAEVTEAYFYPATEEALVYAAPQRVTRSGDTLVVEAKAGRVARKRLEGVLAIGRTGLSVAAEPGPVSAAGAPIRAQPAAGQGISVVWALLGAILGGLILNVMPCVFPILSLKAMTLARAGGDERTARTEAAAYTAGAMLACLALGAVLLALRAGGASVGWAFQLQDPRVILLLFLLVTGIALNLAGLFELPSLGGGPAGGDRLGAFGTGALAAFVATPCTGPFMGAALGAALVLPNAAALAVFGGLGLGLALPFLLLGFVPALRRRLPRPGPWMVRFRRVLAVPMALTAAGLAWILSRQTGGPGLALGVAAAAALAAALWWTGRRAVWPRFACALAVAALGAALLPGEAARTPRPGRDLGAEPFSEARLAALRGEGRPVFVYFTADWCLTCKVNEKAVLDRAEVRRAFEARHVAVLVGDWTRGDADIGRFLAAQGRSGVPLYLWYGTGRGAETLPQILSVGRVTALR
ncbi:MAG TPA: protein-disulfide reductase DsbD domain-containing protein [Allosphingosinicella sp.]|nr:protein-disulfide reductase DsbD domain-containing protein [Allosphingosinicella sp.]